MTIYIPGSGLAAAEARFLAGQNGLTVVQDAAGADLSLLCGEAAHALCADKHAAHDFFARHALAQPHDFPGGSEPYIVKPGSGSCGRGIWSTEDFCEAGGGINAGFLVQEELRGTVVSVTVVGHAGRLCVCPAVELVINDRYDRCGAVYPCAAGANVAADKLARALGEALELDGIVELKLMVTGKGAVILSMNEGCGALAATALRFGALCDPVGALAALAEGREPVFSGGNCRVSLEVEGRERGTRDAEPTGTLEPAADSLTDGRVRLLIQN